MMKSLSTLAAFTLVAVAALGIPSCAPNDTSQATPTYLRVTGSPIVINPAISDTESTGAYLTCGCGFTLKITPLKGDTDKIHVLDTDADTVKSLHSLSFFPVAGTPKGNYSADFALAAGPNPFYDTEHVTLIMP